MVTYVCVRRDAGETCSTDSRPGPANSAALVPVCCRTAGWARWRYRSRGYRSRRYRDGGRSPVEHGVDLVLDESESDGTVFGSVTLMGVGVVSVAAVRVGGIAVGLDVAGVGALVSGGTRSELGI